MKVAVPTRENQVDDHFGHCDHYTIYTIENKKVVERSELPSPQGCGCKSGIAAELQRIGVELMLAGSMGDGAKNKLEAHGIKVIRGCCGPVDSVVGGYLIGIIRDSGQSCAGHGSDHECGEHSHQCQHAE